MTLSFRTGTITIVSSRLMYVLNFRNSFSVFKFKFIFKYFLSIIYYL